MNPRFDLTGEIGIDAATGASIGAFCDANPGPIDVFINSFGGIATEGAAIFAALERHGNATALVQGVAASAASLAMLGAKQVLIADSALVMIHEPGALAFGTSVDMRAMAATLEKMTAVYAAIYSRATGNPVARVAAWMAEETWLTAEEAVALNFADAIAPAGKDVAVIAAAFDYRKFKAAPPHLVAQALKNGWATVSPEPKNGLNA
ncbi:head maturation protease, ClpP-related [Cypionkella sp.]|uniref:head maturation protease, ClpP-related n=1 Tax=Cypionkella sp. TaxID=2811411 RepID=UPI00271E9944|nr:head maturation protease, ClpP-related [Cypionkella sp.]MDO8984257.1 Clp protease ClpP [Cypionkella sp.]